MAKSTPEKLAYTAKKEETPVEIKKREARNKARYDAEVAGKVHKGDGKQVDHKVPLGAGGSPDVGNTRVISTKRNEGWRKGQSGYKPKGV